MNELIGEFVALAVTPRTISSWPSFSGCFFSCCSRGNTFSVEPLVLSLPARNGLECTSLFFLPLTGDTFSGDFTVVSLGVDVLIATNGDKANILRFFCKKLPLSNESLDCRDLRLPVLSPTNSWMSMLSITFPVLADDERSSVTPFQVRFAMRVNFKSGLAGGDPCDITRMASVSNLLSVDRGKLCR